MRLNFNRLDQYFRERPETDRYPWSRFRWTLWTFLLLGGIALAGWAATTDHFPGDINVGRWIQNNNIANQALVDFIRNVGSGIASTITILICMFGLFIFRRRHLAQNMTIFIIGIVLIIALKEITDRPRTSIFFLEQRVFFDSKSFPSGHVMSNLLSTSCIVFISLKVLTNWWIKIPMLVWSIGISILSPWVAIVGGIHWPSDVIGGWVWAGIVIIPGWSLLKRSQQKDRNQI